jgi:hypothetical protein
MRNQKAEIVTGGLLVVSSFALVLLVVTSPGKFLYDEPYFANYIPLLHQYGPTTRFLNSLTGTVGPLYALVHVAFEPLTKLQPARMRLINVLLLVTVVWILAAWLKRQRCSDYLVASCSVLVVPMTWVLAGMALSEMPALMFVTLSLYLQLRGLEALGCGRSAVGWFLGSAIFLGVAVWGRQPYLLLTGVPVLLALRERKLRIPALIFSGVVLAFTIPLFIIWKGLVPPSHHAVQQGLSITNGIISLGYTGICFLLLAPRSRLLPAKLLIGLVVLTTAANALLGGFALYPVRSFADRHLPASVVSAYGNACGSLFLSCGIVFLVVLLWLTWEAREDLARVTLYAGLMCVAVSPVFIAHQYSSRYTGMSLPYLILAAQPWREWRLKTVITSAVGCSVGFLSLLGYFSH